MTSGNFMRLPQFARDPSRADLAGLVRALVLCLRADGGTAGRLVSGQTTEPAFSPMWASVAVFAAVFVVMLPTAAAAAAAASVVTTVAAAGGETVATRLEGLLSCELSVRTFITDAEDVRSPE